MNRIKSVSPKRTILDIFGLVWLAIKPHRQCHLFENQRREILVIEHFVGHFKNVAAGEAVYLIANLAQRVDGVEEQAAAAEVEHQSRVVFGADSQLANHLLFGAVELQSAHSLLAQAAQLAADDGQAAVGFLVVGAKIDAERAGVGVWRVERLDVVGVAVFLAQSQVEAAVHSGAAQGVVYQLKSQTVLVVGGVGAATEDAVRLMSIELNLKQMRRVRIHGYPLEIAFLFGNRAEVALGKPHNGLEIDRPNRADGNLVGVVGAADKPQNISVVVVGNRFWSAQNVATDGVSAENQVLKIVEDEVARRVLVRIYLIHNHFLLFLAFVVGEG